MVDSKIRFSAKRNRTQERWCWAKSVSNSFKSSSFVVGYNFSSSSLLAFKKDHDLFSTSVSMPHSSCIRLELLSDWSQYCRESLVIQNKRKKANSLPSTGCVPTCNWNVNGPFSFSSEIIWSLRRRISLSLAKGSLLLNPIFSGKASYKKNHIQFKLMWQWFICQIA